MPLQSWGVFDWKPYEVTADDGAITTVFHLPQNKKTFKSMNKQSVLVMHGTFMDGSSWFLPKVNGLYDFADDEKPLPLTLLDMGYDVWVGNMRGTQWSRGHTTLDYKDWDSGYWDFTFAEKGMLDVPATIKKIQEVSGSGKVGYIGYSQGTTMMFYALTKETEENFFAENMSAFIALAPCMIPPE